MDKITRVRAEIERRIKIYHESNHGFSLRCDECEELLSFLDTLSEEPDKSLEEAAKDYALHQLDKHFWQDVECFSAGDIDAFIAGAEWQKSQILKEAVEVTVENWNPDPHPEVTIPLNSDEFIAGDKVRIVVLKADD